jgi:mono/diheme cytochrome c family protein
MRRRWIATAAMAAALHAGCAANRRAAYDIPTTMSPEAQRILLERIEKGRVLFKANCAECHGIYGGGRDSIPDFSKEQIDDYDANFVRADARNHAVARKLSQSQVDAILTFLRARKPAGGSTPTGR